MSDSQKWLTLGSVLVVGWLCYLLAPILTPFVAGALLAYLGDPIADRLEPRLGRTGAVAAVFLLLLLVGLGLLLWLVPLLESQVTALIGRIPAYLQWLQEHLLPWLHRRFGVDLSGEGEKLRSELMGQWQSAGGIVAQFLGSVSRSGLKLLGWAANLLLVPVVTFYLLRDWDRLVAEVHDLLPRRQEPVVSGLAREADEVLGAFLRGQLSVMAALGTLYTVGLTLVGLDFALLIGMLAGLVSFVPYLGFIVGIVTAAVAMVMQTHDWVGLWQVALVFGVGQALEGMLLTPWLVGDRIGLHPVAVIFAVLAGGQLFGFFGVLLALPAAAVVAVGLRHLHRHYKQSGLYGEAVADR